VFTKLKPTKWIGNASNSKSVFRNKRDFQEDQLRTVGASNVRNRNANMSISVDQKEYLDIIVRAANDSFDSAELAPFNNQRLVENRNQMTHLRLNFSQINQYKNRNQLSPISGIAPREMT
jgi:hypothetical protein